MFKVGMQVVCIDGFARGVRDPNETHPKKGDVLTIRNFGSDGHLRFEEIINHTQNYLVGGLSTVTECSFNPKKFVPLLSDFKRISFTEVTKLVEVGEN
jgi:hypothetical protein